MKRFFIYLIIFICVFLSMKLSAYSHNSFENTENTQLGKVINVEFVDNNIQGSKISQLKQIVTLQILSGEFKNEIIDVENIITGTPAYDLITKKGDKLILHEETKDGESEFFISDIQRAPFMLVLVGLFALLLIIVGRKKGLCSLLAIFITCFLIVSCLTPLIVNRINPILATMLICIVSTAITMYLVGGINYKSTAAFLGTIVSIFFALILSVITVYFAHITGFSNESCTFLYSSHPEINLQHIAISAILLATLGAIMDIAMSISSAINEFSVINEVLSIKELFKSGMNVGKDIIGTMANTLILVYLGGALPLVLLSDNIDFQKFLNLNQIVTEISAALIGSITLLICVPITAIISATLIKMKKTTNSDIILANKEDLL